MDVKRLENCQLTIASRSYIDAMHGVLSSLSWGDWSKPMLSGMSGFGFRMGVSRRLTAESSSAYNWMAENFLTADFIGITSSQQAGFSFAATFPLYQKQAVSCIKSSIDRGIGAIFWKDGFVIANGYDDINGELYYSDGHFNIGKDGSQTGSHCKRLPYDEFGRNASPYWYYQVFENIVELEEAEVYRESFMQAVNKWEVHEEMLPRDQYACGKEAYRAIIEALHKGDYDKEGARTTFHDYAAAKQDLAHYTAVLQKKWPQSAGTAVRYDKLARLYGSIANLEPDDTASLIPLFEEACETEEAAIQTIKALMRESLDNRFDNIGLR
ncbi:hypothetical protein EBB07_25075 [Paenibacillaceae bacterium]|nr:hypothetical protein EBB07_25075 [Paenibacillaceae bacterium]